MLIKERTGVFVAISRAKIKDLAALTKFRLSFFVVISSVAGYLLGTQRVSWAELLLLLAGGFLVTASSNAFNQIWEWRSDLKMNRTQSRPIPKGSVSISEGIVFASLIGLGGIFLLWFFLNPLSAILASLALFIYVAVYTPLKRITPLSVFVGAFPGAIPPMLGWIAATGTFGLEPGILFAIQFMWQFPHFWSIAWVLDDDYKKGGFRLLPFKSRNQKSAFLILLYTLFTIPVAMLPWVFGMAGEFSMWFSVLCGIFFVYFSFRFYLKQDLKSASRLMFASFFYLPLVLFSYVVDKL